MLGIEDLLKRKPAQLSGGQRQRVAMGRAIVREPDAFLMDEPLSNLDAKLRVEMRAYLSTLHQRLRTTTLYVTHDQTEAMTMGDRVAVMRDGQIQQVDNPQVLYDARQPLRRRLHRLAGDELPSLAADERDRSRLHPGRRGDLRLPGRLVARRPAWRDYGAGRSSSGSVPRTSRTQPSPVRERFRLRRQGLARGAVGSEVIAHFPIAADPILASETMVAARGGEESEDAGHLLQLAAGRRRRAARSC